MPARRGRRFPPGPRGRALPAPRGPRDDGVRDDDPLRCAGTVRQVEFLGGNCMARSRGRRHSGPAAAAAVLAQPDGRVRRARRRDLLRFALRADRLRVFPGRGMNDAGRWPSFQAAAAAEQRVPASDRLAHAVLAAHRAAAARRPGRAVARRCLSKAVQTPDGARRRRRRPSPPTWHRRRCCRACGTASGSSLLVTLIVVPLAFAFAYALTRSCMPFKGAVAHHHAAAAAGAVAAVGDLADLLVRQPGHRQGFLAGAGLQRHLRRAGHRAGRVLRDVSACADDPRHGAVAGRRAAVRGGRFARHAHAAHVFSRSRCPAPSTGWSRPRWSASRW